jgi:hypothetical protein
MRVTVTSVCCEATPAPTLLVSPKPRDSSTVSQKARDQIGDSQISWEQARSCGCQNQLTVMGMMAWDDCCLLSSNWQSETDSECMSELTSEPRVQGGSAASSQSREARTYVAERQSRFARYRTVRVRVHAISDSRRTLCVIFWHEVSCHESRRGTPGPRGAGQKIRKC